MNRLVSRFRSSQALAAPLMRTSESKGHWQLYDSSVALDLTFLPMTRGNAGRNVKSATLVPQRRGACLRQRIDAAFDAAEPAVHIAQQYLGCIRDDRLDLGCAPRPLRQRRGAGERLLAVGGHDRRLRHSAQCRIADPAPMLIDQAHAPTRILARTPRSRLHQDFDPSGRRDAEKPESKKPTKLEDPGIALATTPPAHAHGKPDF